MLHVVGDVHHKSCRPLVGYNAVFWASRRRERRSVLARTNVMWITKDSLELKT
jgi:hypothetical protein